MTDAEIKQISIEIEQAMLGRRFGHIFPLSDTSFAIDFQPHAGSYIFVDFAVAKRGAFLIVRKLKELERSSVHSLPIIIRMRKLLTGRKLISIAAGNGTLSLGLTDCHDPVILFHFQIKGGTPNIFLTDDSGEIVESARLVDKTGQRIGDIYRKLETDSENEEFLRDLRGGTLSSILDSERSNGESEQRFASLAKEARKAVNSEIGKRQKLVKNLASDLANHGDADEWKRLGDLILANISNLRREQDLLFVIDYFDPNLREIAVPAEINKTPTEVAELYFRKYAKARNAVAAIADRTSRIIAEIERLRAKAAEVEAAIELKDEERLTEFVTKRTPKATVSKDEKKIGEFTGARKFVSSDGFEILVGKKAKDNDHLTFRIAKSYDLWLHAADYPGSHVIVRNPNRKEIPSETLVEAARLAAFYSDAREKPKAGVNYTQKKFVNKPRRSAPGLASLSSFKTLLVESGFPASVKKW